MPNETFTTRKCHFTFEISFSLLLNESPENPLKDFV